MAQKVKAISEKSGKLLLKLARAAIEDVSLELGKIPSELKMRRGVFVTLTMNDKLCGCIGNIDPTDELYIAVQKNAKNAAFADPRFDPLQKKHFSKVKIEVSVLSVPEKLKYSGPADLLKQLSATKPGVVLLYAGRRGTFLPQVWEDLPDASEFLSSLCTKAGITENFWRQNTGGLMIKTYTVDKFSE